MRAKFHRLVDALDRPDALVQRVNRLVDHRQQDAIDDEGGKSSDTVVFLPRLSTKRRAVENTASSVAMPRMSSTSSISGTGFMKCMPMNNSGRPSSRQAG